MLISSLKLSWSGDQPLGWRRERSPAADERRFAARNHHWHRRCQFLRFTYPYVEQRDTLRLSTGEPLELCGSETGSSDSVVSVRDALMARRPERSDQLEKLSP